MKRVVVDAPAKINLGLEVIRRRPDGYHDIRSVLAMLELADRLVVFEDDSESDDAVAGVAGPDNLVRHALTRYREAVPASRALGWRITKRIPAAAGLGGASSDAAAALIAANSLTHEALDSADLHRLASDLGSDVPFFLGSTIAIASGRGTDLTPLPSIASGVILVVPNATLEAKTRSMYGALEPGDFGDGGVADQVRMALARRGVPPRSSLRNSFSRAAEERIPELRTIWQALDRLHAGPYALTGAGPASYLLVENDLDPALVARDLRTALPANVDIIETAFRSQPLNAHPESG